MSCRELIESLRRAGDEKVRSLWQDAEAEAGRVRIEIAGRVERLRAEYSRSLSTRAAAAMAAAVSEAHARSRQARLTAETTLSGALFNAAVGSLPRLRDDGYGRVFEQMAQELPSLAWQSVRVNPADIGLAKKHFPAAELVPDETISGGMDATAEGGAVRVVNTLEKRLERAWRDMLPLLIKDVYQEVSDGTPAGT
jgi:V/A-type H+/Na+-transporting ATPase subunit E